MLIQNGTPVLPAPAPAPASASRTATATAIPLRSDRLPGLECLAPLTDEDVWLQDALLGPFSDDILEYLALARATGGPVLDLGAGAGRIAVPLARHGFTVDAVDRDRRSLHRLLDRSRRLGPEVCDRITAIPADLLRLPPHRSCQLALMAGSMIAAVPPRSRPRVLREIAGHLGPRGVLAFDYTAHDPTGLAERPHRVWSFEVPRFDGITERAVARQDFDAVAMRERISYVIERSESRNGRAVLVTTDKWIVNSSDLHRDLRVAGLRVVDERQYQIDEWTRSVLLTCRTDT
ncbi:bifunctional 2-polyprenyl-6-hydroxyphenol methylase/3-demethylubiquinol 3-O-methyltransferase UbiG [Streptomyces sp. WP-1]|uniref:class I SAM-dependent methyltransferase n=1 Tax=Streptomyces sp. WP-1 TaxID=3041497 RepID=UPI00264914B6|nr:class I SAM-dependent methyltransferase [Streptomyces sp. WP-1]WKE67852.1 class I SAM-dependent methyltransferase [Streptomyces sp. WP-1]